MFESENYKFRAKTLKADEAVSGVIQRGGLKSLQPKFVICSSKRVFQRFHKYVVMSERNGRKFGAYRTKTQAAKRLRQIEFFKHFKAKGKR